MNKYFLRTIGSEKIYKNSSTINYSSNIIGKSIYLSNDVAYVEEMIAQGGYGTVYRCRMNHETLALKKLCVNNIQKLSICIQEIYILRSIDNEHITRFVDSIIYQSGADIFEVFILTELYRGNLNSLMKTMHASGRVFEQTMLIYIMSHLSKAVACLHQALPSPIIHRDLKVENVLIAFPQRYVLCDFGSATLKEVRPCDVDRQDLQEDISQSTTISYRSPEMTDLYFDMGEHIIGRKSDIWALGVLMYNMCFFTLPFGESILSIMSGNFTVPDYHSYSDQVMKLLKYCLTIIPKKRPDIYQFSSVIFSLMNESNPIGNTENSDEPCLDDINLPLKESEARLATSSIIQKEKAVTHSVINKPVSTSIKPRDRPKPVEKSLSKSLQFNSSSDNNLTLLQTKVKEDQAEEWTMNQSSMSVLNDRVEPSSVTKPDDHKDLIDFNGVMNCKINQMNNVSKSQSLSKNFGAAGPEQYWNIHNMISQSYQNVPCAPQQLFSNTPNISNMFINCYNLPYNTSGNYPQSSYPISHTSNYSNDVNVGHRRFVSEPGSNFSKQTFTTQNISQQLHSASSHGILQPKKSSFPIKSTSILHEFDPLVN